MTQLSQSQNQYNHRQPKRTIFERDVSGIIRVCMGTYGFVSNDVNSNVM